MPKTLSDADRQAINLKAFLAWNKSYGHMIVTGDNMGVIYAGFGKTNLMKMKKGFQAEPEVTPMWKIIERMEKEAREYSGYSVVDTINVVLQRIKSPLPKLIEATGANAGDPKRYSDMLSCANALASDDWQLLPVKARRRVWNILSKTYVQNLRGDVQIWEGVSKKLRLLEPYKVMLQTELKAIRNNPNVSDKTRKKIEALIKKYESHYGELGKEAKRLDSGLKTSVKRALRTA